jgi:glycerol-3-phosphate acyltransferase PlsY
MTAPLLLTLIGSYLLGSIPSGFLAGRWRGVDLRTAGSGNIGATNALRVLGTTTGSVVLVLDALKGALGATWIPRFAWRYTVDAASLPHPATPVWLGVVGGLAAVLGHTFTCWLRFRGGKGVATSAGVLAGLMPLAFATVLALFLITLALFRFVSLASIVAALALPIAAAVFHPHPLLIGLALTLGTLVVVRHRSNLQRLRSGTEPRLGQRSSPTASSSPPPAP